MLLCAVTLGCATPSTPPYEKPPPDVPGTDVQPDVTPPEDTPVTPDVAKPPLDVPPPEDVVDASTPDTSSPDAPTPPSDVCSAMCNGQCTDIATDPRNCGMCGVDCTALPGVDPMRVTCTRGVCNVTGACVQGRANCTSDSSNGCETAVTTVNNCGACNRMCAATEPLCLPSTTDPSGYACGTGCVAPANMRCGTTCVDTNSDANNCGRCGMICPGGGSCTMGRCTIACPAGMGNCDGMDANGCETPTRNNPLHCGGCGNVCTSGPNGSPTCTNGQCVLTCVAGFGNCDMNNANGCETDLRTSAANCGACANACPMRANAQTVCQASACNIACNTGFGNCDAVVTNGCEADLRTNPLSCGMCNRRCATAPNATPACMAETCAITCTAGYSNCNGNGIDGCESNTATDPMNCGMCGRVCPSATGATAACRAGVCALTCMTGFGDCDGNLMNGCETNTTTAIMHCGGCGMVCNAPSNGRSMCAASRCVLSCDPGYTLVGELCQRMPPRPVLPPSTSVVTSRRPAFKVELPLGQDGAQVEICGDRNCTSVATTVTFMGARGTSPIDLTPGTYWWRARGSVGGSVATVAGSVSVFTVVAPVGGATPSFWGSVLDTVGDRFPEMLVGLPSLNRAQLYTNSSGAYSTSLYTTLTSGSAGGTSVSGAGDVNADGYADVILGAPTSNAVYVHHGNGASVGTVAATTLTAPAGTTRFGAAVSHAGDTNGDGYGDIIVGAPGSNRAFVYLGSAMGVGATPITLVPTAGASNFGISVAGVGDVNGDGFSDVMVGTDGSNVAYLWYGAMSGLAGAPIPIGAPSGASGFGRSVAGAGDTNGDGLPDILVGAYSSNTAYVFRGATAGVTATPATTLAVSGALQFGFTVRAGGDLNADGYCDVLVGAPLSDRVYAFMGSSTGTAITPAITVPTPFTSSRFGEVIGGIGDYNRDGYWDFAVGIPSRSYTYVYRSTGTTAVATYAYTGSTSFGSAVAGL
jgi:hypothetical protein